MNQQLKPLMTPKLSKWTASLIAIAIFTSMSFSLAVPTTTKPLANIEKKPIITNGWARATIEGQEVTGGFLDITTKNTVLLINANSPVAKTTEIHEMRMENNVMRMRQVPNITIPAGKTVSLKPGGYHIMLIGLKKPLSAGSKIPLSLTFKPTNRPSKAFTIKTQLTVRPIDTPTPTSTKPAMTD